MRGYLFSSLEELSAVVIRAICQMNKDGVLEESAKLSELWYAVIERQGLYGKIVNRYKQNNMQVNKI